MVREVCQLFQDHLCSTSCCNQSVLLTQTLCCRLSSIFWVHLSLLAFKFQHGKISGSTPAPKSNILCRIQYSFMVTLVTSLWPDLDGL